MGNEKMREEDVKNVAGAYARTVTVTEDMTDDNGNMTVLAIASNMQQAAGDQLIDLGIGFDFTSSRGLLWVVVWSLFDFQKYPKCGDKITFYTWPGKKKHWFYPRRAYVFDASGQELVHASYLWMLMDADTRKVTDDGGVLGEIPAVKIEGECELPSMKADFPETLAHRTLRNVDDTEIDDNRHLNNAHYLNWTAQIAMECGMNLSRLKTLWINYKKEILPGDTVELQYESVENELFVSGGEQEKFIARLGFSA